MVGVDDLGVIEFEARGTGQGRGHDGRDRGGVDGRVVLDGPLAGEQGVVELRRHGALVRGQIGVAAGQGQAVRVPYDRATEDLDGQREVGHEAADHRQLLEVLLPEVGPARPRQREQLGHDGGHPVEVSGPRRPFHGLGEALYRDGGDGRPGEELVGGRRQHQMGAGLAGQPAVLVEMTGVGGQVLAGSELERVDVNGHRHGVAVGRGTTDQRQVPGVQGPHGQDQSHPLARRPAPVELGAPYRWRSDEFDGH